ncbi:peptidyl-prolyl cis-trans isomerase [Arthrobacter crystallopoietes BAB-32]|uniref:Peptidyl-prolyl cis-trans isomerase n=1 Tax=Arthrobacter crystallopoietes BAB-32 TaxID=1246476 RepID=N1V0U7_9MICC|nr:DUF4190 domain-containing protein [Arthrobacter crystallopoietes]EMY34945.1 peptidyl-prolyl cis-trans isomerase [Arthrobacter crystallopoietes BAB-32]
MTSPYPQNQSGAGYPPAQPNRTNPLAIASLISSFFISILGIVLGHIALSQIKRTGEGGRGLAIAGLIIGYVSLVAGILIFISIMGLVATQVETSP